MKVIISCCLFAFLLSCNLTAAITHKIVEQKNPIALPCPHPVDKVKWSREKNGNKTDLMTVEDDKETKHISDPYKHYSSLADKSLQIRRVNFSDDGRYLCNDEAAVDLTVIPTGTVVHEATERTRVTLKCPDVSDDHGWWTDVVDIQQQRRFVVSKAKKTLTIKKVNAADSGLYYCGEKPAAYLNVIRDDVSDRGHKAKTTKPPTRQTAAATVPLTTRANSNMATTKKEKSNNKSTEDEDNSHKAKTTKPPTRQTAAEKTVPLTTANSNMVTTKQQKSKNKSTDEDNKRLKTQETTLTTTLNSTQSTDSDSKNTPGLVLWMYSFIIILIIILIIIVTVYCKKRRFKKGGKKEEAIYEEIPDALFQPKNDRLNQNDPTYSTISELPLMEKPTDTILPNESPYSCIGDTLGRDYTDLTQSNESPYFLLKEPETPENNDDVTSAV